VHKVVHVARVGGGGAGTNHHSRVDSIHDVTSLFCTIFGKIYNAYLGIDLLAGFHYRTSLVSHCCQIKPFTLLTLFISNVKRQMMDLEANAENTLAAAAPPRRDVEFSLKAFRGRAKFHLVKILL